MIFEHITTGGCQSYLVGCADTRAAVLIDPEITQLDRYLGLAAHNGLHIRYLIDTHTHADHFSATAELARRLAVPVVMHRESGAPFVDMRVDDGEMMALGRLRLQVLHTPGHTRDSVCLVVEDRVFTGDTLLIGATGRTDLPGGDPEALHESLFQRLLRLDSGLKVFPAHEYKGRSHSSMGQLLAEAAARVPFMSLTELRSHIEGATGELLVLDVREREAFERGHIPGARLLPRGQLELRVNEELPDPTRRILAYCELGQISTLAAATLRNLGFQRAVALDGGMQAWREAGFPVAA